MKLDLELANKALALMGKGDVPGHDFHGNQWTEGQTARFEGRSADGKVEGGMDVKIINPHSNAGKVTHADARGRQYEGTFRHIPTATVERPARSGSFPTPAKQFEAYHHTLSLKR